MRQHSMIVLIRIVLVVYGITMEDDLRVEDIVFINGYCQIWRIYFSSRLTHSLVKQSNRQLSLPSNLILF